MYEQQFNPYGSNLAIVKGYFKSGKILTLGIFYVISVVFSIILSTSIPYGALVEQALEYMRQSGVDIPANLRSTLISSVSASTISTIIISSIVPILTAVAFIIMFAKSRNTANDSSPITGITILHVLAVISFVFTLIGVIFLGFLYIALFVVAMIAVNNVDAPRYAGSGAVVAMVLVGVVYAVFAFISIFYAASCKNFYRSAKRSINTPNLESKGAVPYGVFNILLAVVSFINMIVYMVMFPPLAGIVFFSFAISILINIFTAIMALGYSKYINRQKNEINTAPYGAAPYNPAPAAPVYNTPNYANPQPQNQPYPNAADPNMQEPISVQPKATFCPNCGAKTEPNAPFCPNCGTKL